MRQSNRGTHLDECASQTLRLLIVSEVRFVRESLEAILGRGGGIQVVGHCSDSALVWRACQDSRPDMVLIDAALQHGHATVRSLRKQAAGLHVVVFAVSESVESILTWAEAGAVGYIPCTAATADLEALIADIGAGRQRCSALVAAGLLQRIANPPVRPPDRETATPALTAREHEIACLVSNGLSNKEIARHLNIGLATIKSHVHNTLIKLNVQRRGQLAASIRARALAE